jgi:hypothetical protein
MRAVIAGLMLLLMACHSPNKEGEDEKQRKLSDLSTPEHIKRIEADKPNHIAVLLYRGCNFDGSKYWKNEYGELALRGPFNNPSSVWDGGSLDSAVWLTLMDLSLSEEEQSQLSTLVSTWDKDGLRESDFAEVVSAMEQAGLVSKEGSVLKRTSAGEECFNSVRSTLGKMYDMWPFFRLEKKMAAEQRQRVAKQRQLKDPSTPEHIKRIEADEPNHIAVLLYRGCNFDGFKYWEDNYWGETKRRARHSCVVYIDSISNEEMVWLTLLDLEGGQHEFATLEDLWKKSRDDEQFTLVASAMEQAGLVSKEGSRLTPSGEECLNSLRSTFRNETSLIEQERRLYQKTMERGKKWADQILNSQKAQNSGGSLEGKLR